MNPNNYLKAVLASQELGDDSQELRALRKKREEVEAIVSKEFGHANPTIRYGGSKAKGTMNRESYDLDIINYYPVEENGAGETLEDIFNNTKSVFEKHFIVQPKGSALRLLGKDRVDVHVDIVPGRYTDDTKTDAFLFRSTGEKKRLKTNLDKHIAHIKDSGVTDTIRLGKLWKVRNGIFLKTFPLELLIVEILRRAPASISDQFLKVMQEFRDNIDSLKIEDPANPTGNDLSETLTPSTRQILSSTAEATLLTIEERGWEAVFGTVEETEDVEKVRNDLRRAATAIQSPTKPWSNK